MANDRYVNRDDDFLDPEDVNSAPASASASASESASESAAADPTAADPAAEVPVPLAMSPAEVDERAKAVDAVRSRGRAPRKPGDPGFVA